MEKQFWTCRVCRKIFEYDNPPKECPECGHRTGVHWLDDTVQRCPKCGSVMSAIAGRKDAICQKCGYKEPCC